ncbi:MAG TPA: hypothetical protein VMF63_00365 [Opitutaceae bacterium]|nr:hypothetical protein [Opitutaceae bacterium]
MKKSLQTFGVAVGLVLAAGVGVRAADYRLAGRIALPGNGSWDYLTADPAARRLYVTHGTCVHVLDLDTQKPVGEIAPTPGVHGVALAPELGRGFTSNGAEATVTVFDLKTLGRVGILRVNGTKPDAILYDPFTRRVFTFNGDSDNSSAFDAVTGEALGTIELGGGPEFAVSDGAGHCFVNLEEEAEVVRFDPKKLEITARWPLAPGATATALALDAGNHRLFAGCRSRVLVILDADTGAHIAELPIGGVVDAVALDTLRRRAFVACGEGVVNVIGWTDPAHYSVLATIPTRPGAKTLGYDAKTGRLYLSVADFGPAPAAAPGQPNPRPPILPGSFGLLVVEPAGG